jgi:hypothetical protein
MTKSSDKSWLTKALRRLKRLEKPKGVGKGRCWWCRGKLPRGSSRGRPRRFCSQSHRQRLYEARKVLVARPFRLVPEDIEANEKRNERIREICWVLEELKLIPRGTPPPVKLRLVEPPKGEVP